MDVVLRCGVLDCDYVRKVVVLQLVVHVCMVMAHCAISRTIQADIGFLAQIDKL